MTFSAPWNAEASPLAPLISAQIEATDEKKSCRSQLTCNMTECTLVHMHQASAQRLARSATTHHGLPGFSCVYFLLNASITLMDADNMVEHLNDGERDQMPGTPGYRIVVSRCCREVFDNLLRLANN